MSTENEKATNPEAEGDVDRAVSGLLKRLASDHLKRFIIVLLIGTSTVAADKLFNLLGIRVTEEGQVERLNGEKMVPVPLESPPDRKMAELEENLAKFNEMLTNMQKGTVSKAAIVELQYRIYRLEYDIGSLQDEMSRMQAQLDAGSARNRKTAIHSYPEVPKPQRPAPMALSEFELQVLNGNLVDEKSIH